MSRARQSDRSGADHGEAVSRFADSHGRQGQGPPARLPRPRSAERAPGIDLLALQLAYDSFREPVPAGRRGGQTGSRHLVYLSTDYAVDVRLDPRDGEQAVLHGELLSRRHGPVAEIPTFLLDGDEIAGYARTGPLGEFQLQADGAVDLRLCLLLDAERCIDVPLDVIFDGFGYIKDTVTPH